MPDSGANAAVGLIAELPYIAPNEMELRCSLFRMHELLQTEIAGRNFRVVCEGEARSTLPDDQSARLELAIGAHRASLDVPAVLVADWLMAFHPALGIDTIDEAMLGMLIELIFARQFATLEAASCLSATIARRQNRSAAGGLALQLHCIWGEASYPAVLHLDRALAADFGRFAARAPLVRRDLPDLPLSVAVRLGTAVVPFKALDGLKRGDVIMPHSPPLSAGKAEIVLAGRWSAPGALAAGRFTAQAPLAPFTEHVMDSENTIERPDRPEDGALDDLAVKLVFEVGRCDTTLGELRAMGPGHVFALGRDPEQSVDIVTGGRKVGSGELVRIGERLGVRVLRLSKDG